MATASRHVALNSNCIAMQSSIEMFHMYYVTLRTLMVIDFFFHSELISEFDFFLKHEVDSEEPSIAVSQNSVSCFMDICRLFLSCLVDQSLTEVMTTGLRQLVDNRERMFEQIK